MRCQLNAGEGVGGAMMQDGGGGRGEAVGRGRRGEDEGRKEVGGVRMGVVREWEG